jgi:two-component system, cell cycle sensor histidine kinase and response regulator CckA
VTTRPVLSAERLLQALGEAPALLAVLRGPELTYAFVNDAYRRSVGNLDLLGNEFGIGGRPESMDLKLVLQRVFATGEAWAKREVGVGDLYYDVNFRPFRDDDGKIDGVIIQSFDVTSSVKARQALATSEAHQRRLFDSNMLGIAFWGPDGHVSEANDEYLRIVGYDRADLLASHIDRTQMTPPEYASLDRHAVDEIIERGVCKPFEKEYLRKDGRRVPVMIGCCGFDALGTTGATFVVDLSDRARGRRAEALLATVVDHAPVMLFACDESGTITFAGGRELVNLGYDPSSVVGKSAFELNKERPQIVAALRRALEGEAFAVELDFTTVVLEAHMSPLHGAAGHRSGCVGVAANVTARKQAEETREKMQAHLLQVQKLESLGVLAGGIAHDFNNLLTGILGNASIALMSLPSDSKTRHPLEDIVSIARRAADLTRQMLAYSGKGRFEVHPLDVSEHVGEIAQLLESTLAKKVQLRLELARGLPAVEADVAQIQQVVMNLVINGAEAIGDRRGAVLVTTGVQDLDGDFARELFPPDPIQPGRYVFIEVRDDGCGMDDATRAKIFDPFFTTKFAGRGLGLAAVLGIVRGHKGALHIHSEPGRGTTFKVFFPSSARETRKPVRRALSGQFRGEGLVLVVDDERHLRTSAARILEHFGFRTVEAANGREAVDIFRKRGDEVVAVLLDMTMPEMSGEESFRELRKMRPDVRVVLSSGYSEHEAIRRFSTKGLVGFLQKPYTADELAEKMRAALG